MTPEDLNKLAALAGMDMDADEGERLREELARMVEYVERLEEAETEGVEPLMHPVPDDEFETDGRADEVSGELSRERLMRNAPASSDGEFEVPDVDDGE